jgi:hypothetical protein
MGKKAFIVWNEAKNEGAVFLDRGDADQCQRGEFSGVYSSLGEYFAESYEDDARELQEVEV